MNNTFQPIKNALTVSKNRIWVCLIVCALVFTAIISQCVRLQIIEYNRFHELALKNHKRIHPILPKRGRIFDRNGMILADNRKAYQVSFEKNHLPLDQVLHIFKKYSTFEIDDQKLTDKYHLAKVGEPVLLASALPEIKLGELLAHQTELPIISSEPSNYRHYSYGQATSHLIGTIGEISQDEYRKLSALERKYKNISGKSGLEKAFNDSLSGEPGWVSNEETAQGKVTESSILVDEKHGWDIQLTIDIDLQLKLMKIMSQYTGVAIVVDNRNGEILAAISSPSFDPNLPSNANIPLKNHQRWPYFNRLTSGLYPPASTVKPFIALEALSLNIIDANTSINDPGYYDIPGGKHRYHDWKRDGHGQVSVRKAIAESCDTFFYHLSTQMGSNNIFHALQNFGLGIKTDVELPHEKSGLIPNKSWKQGLGKRWYLGDTINMGIGQGASLVTPMQLAQATMLLANHGKAHKIHLIKRISQNDTWTDIPLKETAPITHTDQNWQIIDEALKDVIEVGTGFRFGKNTYKVAGKTGTAQVVSLDAQNDSHYAKDHSLFIGYAPYDNPEISVVVILEHNSLASRVARDIFHTYFKEIKKS